MTDADLEQAVEDLCSTQVEEDELKDRIAELAKNADIETINELPLLYRLEIKKVLKDQHRQRAMQIRA